MPSQPNPFCVFGTLRYLQALQFWRRGASLAAVAVWGIAFCLCIIFTYGHSVAWAQTAAADQATPPTLGTLPQALASPPPPVESGIIGLRRHVVVRDDVVRLGDLFDGGVANPSKALFRAPAPGETVQLDVGYLSRLAREEGLSWRPLSQNDSATVTRASNRITYEELLPPLIAALAPLGISPNVDLDLTPAPPPLAVSADAIPEILVSNVRLDRASGRFSALLTITAVGNAPIELPLNGIAYETIDIPVSASTTMRDKVLQPEDIAWQRVRTQSLAAGVATTYDQVLGRETRRVLRPGEPFRLRDLQRPILVKKGGLVTMILSTPMMSLTAQGKALEDGALGDVIKIQNPRSGKTILGTVVENRTVTVDAGAAMQGQ
jgi:flagella basal body P-ring formation protein FlgA